MDFTGIDQNDRNDKKKTKVDGNQQQQVIDF